MGKKVKVNLRGSKGNDPLLKYWGCRACVLCGKLDGCEDRREHEKVMKHVRKSVKALRKFELLWMRINSDLKERVLNTGTFRRLEDMRKKQEYNLALSEQCRIDCGVDEETFAAFQVDYWNMKTTGRDLIESKDKEETPATPTLI